MTEMRNDRENGFALIFSMLTLLLLTIIVVSSVRTTTMNEQMAGSYMDRNRAYQAAELAIRQGQARLSTNADTCLLGCVVTSATDPLASGVDTPNTLPDSFTGNTEITATNAGTAGTYRIRQLNDTYLPSGKVGCKAYSIMGQGKGVDSRTVVVLQTVAFMCSV